MLLAAPAFSEPCAIVAADPKKSGAKIKGPLPPACAGRSIEARTANLRGIDWGEFGANFAVLFFPGAIAAANPPETDASQEDAIASAIKNAFAPAPVRPRPNKRHRAIHSSALMNANAAIRNQWAQIFAPIPERQGSWR